MREAAVVVRSGPAGERGWLALRLALALSMAHRVTVVLSGEGAAWALPVDAGAWLGGDPGADLAGLVDDAGATVLVDGASLRVRSLDAAAVRAGVTVAGDGEVMAVLRRAALVVPV